MDDKKDRIEEFSTHEKVLERGVKEHFLICICSALGLACLFGGIWLGDAELNEATGSVHATLFMRIVSFVIYILFLSLASRMTKSPKYRINAFFFTTVVLGLICYVTALVLLFVVLPCLEASQSAVIIWVAFVLTKVIGAPATIGLVCVYSQLGRTLTLRMGSLGILGAFLIYSIVSQVTISSTGPDALLFAIATVLIVVACACGMVGLNKRTFGTIKLSHGGGVTPIAVKRPLENVVTPGLLIVLLMSSLTLGLLRCGYITGDAHSQPASIVILALLLVLLMLYKPLRIEHLFYAALICTAASVLLVPIASAVDDGIARILTGAGTALFEVVVWVYAVWTARNSAQTLMAAAIARTVTVAGHLVGTLAVGVGLWLAADEADIANVSGMLIMFIYIIMLLVILKNPGMKSPVMAIESMEESFYAPGAQLADVESNDRTKEEPNSDEGQSVSAEETVADAPHEELCTLPHDDFEEVYWTRPIQMLAKTYRLTPREIDVLNLVARGHSLASVGEALFISHNTVKMHMRNIYTKLEAHCRQDVIDLVELVRKEQSR